MNSHIYRFEDLQVNLDPDGERDETLHSSIVWRTQGIELPSIEGGEDEGSILIRIAVDGQFDGIYADLSQTSPIQGLDRAIETLAIMREHLSALYGDRPPVGRCLAFGDTGRCVLPPDHAEGQHDFPKTQHDREWRAGWVEPTVPQVVAAQAAAAAATEQGQPRG